MLSCLFVNLGSSLQPIELKFIRYLGSFRKYTLSWNRSLLKLENQYKIFCSLGTWMFSALLIWHSIERHLTQTLWKIAFGLIQLQPSAGIYNISSQLPFIPNCPDYGASSCMFSPLHKTPLIYLRPVLIELNNCPLFIPLWCESTWSFCASGAPSVKKSYILNLGGGV